MEHVLVIANQTLTSDELVAAVLARNATNPATFHIIAPATPLSDQELALRHSEHPGAVALESGPVVVARMRLAKAMTRLREAKIDVTGDIGDPNPFEAAAVAMRATTYDHVIVSTLPRRMSRWLSHDLPTKISRKFDVEVTHVETGRTVTKAKHADSAQTPPRAATAP
jgi:hypothetical protein